ncbi:trypsin domain-containing protein [Ditylenchus destructor]|uniref:Trypsin domain-containing protein n=1 Tax=Ditylenchus destructor TaxID=166010 RepID=A0AAD4MKY0_9BILA|nr:trypsin domain-containing protein [Ditylenchus destructor]
MIIHGVESKPGRWPWLAYVDGCSGTIISREYVLTAAHCGVASHTKVIVGVANVSSPQSIVVPVEYSQEHPDFSKHVYETMNDIRIVKLGQPLNFTKYIRPICLPKIYNDALKQDAVIAGWGGTKETIFNGTNVLHEGKAQLTPSDDCKKNYEHIYTYNYTIIPKVHICAYGRNDTDVWHGDSGGPLMVSMEDNNGQNRWFEVSITSFGYRRYEDPSPPPVPYPQAPSVYTRITTFCDWIAKMTSNSVQCREL